MSEHSPQDTETDYSLRVLSGRDWGQIVAAERGLDFPEETASTIERIVRERMAQAWDEGATKASEYGGAFLRSYLAENPYRDGVSEHRT